MKPFHFADHPAALTPLQHAAVAPLRFFDPRAFRVEYFAGSNPESPIRGSGQWIQIETSHVMNPSGNHGQWADANTRIPCPNLQCMRAGAFQLSYDLGAPVRILRGSQVVFLQAKPPTFSELNSSPLGPNVPFP